jgi:hypothetical protein
VPGPEGGERPLPSAPGVGRAGTATGRRCPGVRVIPGRPDGHSGRALARPHVARGRLG